MATVVLEGATYTVPNGSITTTNEHGMLHVNGVPMIDWHGKKWQPGAKVRYHQGHGHKPAYCDVHPGLFWYSGWGEGRLFRPDGTILDCSRTEAYAECKRLGIEMRFVDSFVVSSFTSVMG